MSGPDDTGSDTAPQEGAATTSVDLIDGAAQALEGFDPSKHEVTTDGAPVLTPTGRFKKKPKRQAQEATKVDAPATENAAPQTPASPARKRQVRVTSDQTASMVLNFCVGGMASVVGPEWDFQSPEEATSLKAAASAYLEAKNAGQMSPEMMLLLAIGAYSLPRVAVPNTRQKFKIILKHVWNSCVSAVSFWKKK